MEFHPADHTTGFVSRQVGASISESASVPSLIENAGQDTKRRFVEFFAANIRNRNTRKAYLRAVDRFCSWCEQHGLKQLVVIEPTMIAFYVEEMADGYSKASVKPASCSDQNAV